MSKATIKNTLESLFYSLEDEWLEEYSDAPMAKDEMNEYSASDRRAAKNHAAETLSDLLKEIINNN